jgi:aryl-alcohol dehydrogenase-like predicted oxidoreductase
MLYRTLGHTGEKVSAIGVGGHHLGLPDVSEDLAIRIIRNAIERGINFLDNSWDYHEGKSERRMGRALRDGYRDKVFLMTKIDGRTKESAAKQIDESLKRLQTDVIDLMQHHEVIRLEDPDRIFGEGGAQEAMLAAKKAGKIRYIGFTGGAGGAGAVATLVTAAGGVPVRRPRTCVMTLTLASTLTLRMISRPIGSSCCQSAGSGFLMTSSAPADSALNAWPIPSPYTDDDTTRSASA